MKKTGVIFLILAWMAGNCPGAVSFSYLNNPAGARPVGMAEAFAGIPGNIYGVYYNPASIYGIKHTELGFSHVEFLQGVRYEYAALVLPLPAAVLGISAVYVNNGVQERRDIYGVVTGEFTPYQFIPQVSVAVEPLKGFSLGLNLKIPYEVIDDYTNFKPFFDIGLNTKLFERFYAGFNAQNLGTSENLPANLKAGVAYIGHEMNFCADLNAPNQGEATLSLGFEFKAVEMLTLRAGYRRKLGEGSNTLEGITAGFGAMFGALSLDYGYRSYDELGASHFISMTVVLN